VAQTRRKRRRKHRGTQGGRIDTRPVRGRARSRAEAQARARSRTKKKSGPKTPGPQSWSSALKKGAVAAVLFVGLLALFGQNPLVSVLVGVLMLGFYVPMAYLMDRFFYQRHLRKEAQKQAEREAERRGLRETGS
jgi:Flp pilus assembly protein TadB